MQCWTIPVFPRVVYFISILPFYKVFNLFSGGFHLGTLDGEALFDLGRRKGCLEVADAAAEATPLVGGERDHGLAAPVVSLQEGGYAHGVSTPPAGPAKINRIILGNVDIGFQGRAGLGIQLFLGFPGTFIVVGRVLFDGFQLEDIGPGELLNLPGHNGGVAHFQVHDAVGGVILPRAGIINHKVWADADSAARARMDERMSFFMNIMLYEILR